MSAVELRVMTCNVRSLRGDADALASAVRAGAPDVLLVQAAPRFLRWRSKRAALARHCGLVVATAERPGGLCVMTALRVDVVDTSISLLPKTFGHHQSALVSALLAFGGVRWRVMSVCFSTDPAERSRQLPVVAATMARVSPEPLIVGGDLNEQPDEPVLIELVTRLQDCFAVAGSGSGGTAPTRRRSAILADSSLSVVSCEPVDVPGVGTASHHGPVLAVLRNDVTASS